MAEMAKLATTAQRQLYTNSTKTRKGNVKGTDAAYCIEAANA